MSSGSSRRKRTRVTATSARSPRSSRNATPLITSWVRPESRRRNVSASAGSRGLPKARPSRTTAVSTPRTRAPATAAALRRAFSATRRRGSPPVSSSTSGTSTRKSIPSCSRIARRWGEREARMRGSGVVVTNESECHLRKLREEQRGLPPGRLGRVGAMDQVRLNLEAEVAADRARRRFQRVCRADHLAGRGHRLVTLENHCHKRAAGDEVDQVAEEGPFTVLGVVLLGEVAIDRHVLHGDDRESLAFKAADDLAGQTALERIRLHQDQGLVHGSPFELV